MAAAADQRRTPDPQVEPRATNRRFSAAYKQKIHEERVGEHDRHGLSGSGGVPAYLVLIEAGQALSGSERLLDVPSGSGC